MFIIKLNAFVTNFYKKITFNLINFILSFITHSFIKVNGKTSPEKSKLIFKF